MDVRKYLDRIKFPSKEVIRADLETLYLVQSCQQQNIAYENVDVLLGKRIILKNDVLYHKMVEQRRGGWCHELNGLLGWALRELGYDVKLVSVNSCYDNVTFQEEYNHMGVLVNLDDGLDYFVDAGSSRTETVFQPIPLIEGAIMVQPNGRYKFKTRGLYWQLMWQLVDEPEPEDNWLIMNRFKTDPCKLEDFQSTTDRYQRGENPTWRQQLCLNPLIVKRDVKDAGFHLIVGRKYRFSRPIGSTKRHVIDKEDDLSLQRFGELLKEKFEIEVDVSGVDWSQVSMEEGSFVKAR